MKSITIIIASCFLAVLTLISCSLETQPCPLNDSIHCALAVQVPFTMNSYEAQKEAYFKLNLQKSDYPILISDFGIDSRLMVEILDDQLNLVSSALFLKEDEDEFMTFSPLIAGKIYFLRFTDLHFCTDSEFSCAVFSIKVDWDSSDPYEPNNSLEDATPAAKGDSLSPTIGHTGDLDFFRLVLTEQDTLNFSVKNVPASLRMTMRILDGSGLELASSTALCEGHPVTLPYVFVPGTYYLQLLEKNNHAAFNETYNLTIK